MPLHTTVIRYERVAWPPRPHAGEVGRPGWWTATATGGGRSAWVQAPTREEARLRMMAFLRGLEGERRSQGSGSSVSADRSSET